MSIFDSILSGYWFNKFEEKFNEDIIENCNKTIKSIEKRREEKDERLEAGFEILKKACGGKRHKLNFLRSLLAKNYSEDQKNIVDNNNSFNIIKEENNINNLEDINEDGLF